MAKYSIWLKQALRTHSYLYHCFRTRNIRAWMLGDDSSGATDEIKMLFREIKVSINTKCNTAILTWPLSLWICFLNYNYLNRTSACHAL